MKDKLCGGLLGQENRQPWSTRPRRIVSVEQIAKNCRMDCRRDAGANAPGDNLLRCVGALIVEDARSYLFPEDRFFEGATAFVAMRSFTAVAERGHAGNTEMFGVIEMVGIR